MKRILSILLCLFFIAPAYGQDFNKIKEGASRESIIEEVGKPSKVIKKEKYEEFEYWIWYKKDNTWVLLLEKGMSAGEPTIMEALLTNLLNMAYSMEKIFEYEEREKEKEGVLEEKEISKKQEKQGRDKQLESIKKNITITVLDARIIETFMDEREAGFRLKIKNNSDETIYRMKIVVFFYDKNGKVFYEETRVTVNSESWKDPVTLKPNYSIVYPEADESVYSTVEKMDINEWDEGKIKVEVLEVEITSPE